MRKIQYDGEALMFFEGEKRVTELITDNPEKHPKLKRDWLNGAISWNVCVLATCNSDEYEASAPE